MCHHNGDPKDDNVGTMAIYVVTMIDKIGNIYQLCTSKFQKQEKSNDPKN